MGWGPMDPAHRVRHGATVEPSLAIYPDRNVLESMGSDP
jgi:hypothetical protein